MNKINLSKGLLFILVNGTIAFSNIPKVSAENYVVPPKNKVMTTDSVNMRSYNSKESDRVGKIEENQEVEVLISYDDDWDLVRYKNRIGFVSREFLDGIVDHNFDSNISLIGGYVTAKEDVRLRLGPSTKYEKIGSLYTGQEVEVIGVTDDNWFIVREDEKIGYVSGEYVTYSQTKNDDNDYYEPIINKNMYIEIFVNGIFGGFLCLIFLKLNIFKNIIGTNKDYFMTAYFALFIFLGIFNSFSSRTEHVNIFKDINKNKVFLIIFIFIFFAQIFIITVY